MLHKGIFVVHPSATGKESIKVELGKDEKYKRSFITSGIVMENENNLYVLEKKMVFFGMPKYYISIFDKAKMGKQKQVELVLPKKVDGKTKKKVVVKFEGIEVIGKNMVMITSFYDRKVKTTAVFMQRIDDAGKLDSKIIELETIAATQTKTWIKLTFQGGFDVVSSDDNSKFMVIKREHDFERTADAKVHLKVFDKELNAVWSGDLVLPLPNMAYNIYSYQLDNNGNVYLLTRKWKMDVKVSAKTGKKKMKVQAGKKDAPNYFFSLLYYDYKKETFKNYEIDLGAKRITDIVFKANPNNNDIICAGFYTSKGYAWGLIRRGMDMYIGPRDAIGGAFYVRIDKQTANIVASDSKDFDEKFKKLFIGKKTSSSSKDGVELLDFNLNNFVIMDDGSAALIAEKQFVNHYRLGQASSGGGPVTVTANFDYYFYHYEDLLVVKFKNDGKVDWYSRIPKKQVTINDGGYASSYMLNVSNGKMHFIFLDSKKSNEKLAQQAKSKLPLKSPTMNMPELSVANLVTLEMDGTMTRTNLFSSSKTKMVIIPGVTDDFVSLTNPNQLYTYGVNYDLAHWFFPFLPLKYKYSRVTFEQ